MDFHFWHYQKFKAKIDSVKASEGNTSFTFNKKRSSLKIQGGQKPSEGLKSLWCYLACLCASLRLSLVSDLIYKLTFCSGQECTSVLIISQVQLDLILLIQYCSYVLEGKVGTLEGTCISVNCTSYNFIITITWPLPFLQALKKFQYFFVNLIFQSFPPFLLLNVLKEPIFKILHDRSSLQQQFVCIF